MHLVGFIIRNLSDARSQERQMLFFCLKPNDVDKKEPLF